MVRVAPGVWSISARVMSVVGVTESVAESEIRQSFDLTILGGRATGAQCAATGFVPEAIVSGWVTMAKPGAATVSR